MAPVKNQKLVKLDGRTGEGRGQLVRVSTAVVALDRECPREQRGKHRGGKMLINNNRSLEKTNLIY